MQIYGERCVMEQKQCVFCRTRFTPSRNLHQCYCSKSACQKKRRSKYQKKKLKRDSDYKEAHHLSQQKWRNRHPNYWRQYRIDHPMYVAANRLAQTKRDHKKRKNKLQDAPVFSLANMYPFINKNEYFSCGYDIILCGNFRLQICTL
jgi:hypothetical protein